MYSSLMEETSRTYITFPRISTRMDLTTMYLVDTVIRQFYIIHILFFFFSLTLFSFVPDKTANWTGYTLIYVMGDPFSTFYCRDLKKVRIRADWKHPFKSSSKNKQTNNQKQTKKNQGGVGLWSWITNVNSEVSLYLLLCISGRHLLCYH